MNYTDLSDETLNAMLRDLNDAVVMRVMEGDPKTTIAEITNDDIIEEIGAIHTELDDPYRRELREVRELRVS